MLSIFVYLLNQAGIGALFFAYRVPPIAIVVVLLRRISGRNPV